MQTFQGTHCFCLKVKLLGPNPSDAGTFLVCFESFIKTSNVGMPLRVTQIQWDLRRLSKFQSFSGTQFCAQMQCNRLGCREQTDSGQRGGVGEAGGKGEGIKQHEFVVTE